MTKFEPTELKALFGQLVDAVGTQEAAATFLGISRQRVGQLISTSNHDLPTWAQVFRLEQVCEHSIVFSALARRVSGGGARDAMASAVEASAASAAVLQTVHEISADGILDGEEIGRAQDRARASLAAAQRQFDATMQLRPTPRSIA